MTGREAFERYARKYESLTGFAFEPWENVPAPFRASWEACAEHPNKLARDFAMEGRLRTALKQKGDALAETKRLLQLLASERKQSAGLLLNERKTFASERKTHEAIVENLGRKIRKLEEAFVVINGTSPHISIAESRRTRLTRKGVKR